MYKNILLSFQTFYPINIINMLQKRFAKYMEPFSYEVLYVQQGQFYFLDYINLMLII